ncbi:Na+/H+ antiporter subunit E [Ahrensia marina]|uniref:Cation:proton antiporter n=1 Tax=Ahrensia marina TaxID=1514904 RepID=A0A0N0E8E7_9HYPH|nr:Na+/H+ antiporter subunit E [Ahrensia marina]KPB02255.1 cation:proton antiporter [Ahrensia marina]
MNLYVVNLLLAMAWMTLTDSFSLGNMIFGFVLSAAALSLIREQVGSVGYFSKIGRILSLLILFLYELVMSAVRVAILVVKPNMNLKPGIFAYQLQVDRDHEITLLANLITLTPGTLSVDVSEDRSTLYIHALDCSDVDQIRKDIAEGFERKILEAFR